ncbi:MAG: dihydrolipoamide acetyltransferase family protein [Thermodesulfobacteriota bacterium]
MKLEVIMPRMGESVVEGTVVKWLKSEGDRVEKDEPLVEISTDKVDTEIPAPASGILTQIVVHEGETIQVGTTMAYLETEEAAEQAPMAAPKKEERVPTAPQPSRKEEVKVVPLIEAPARAREGRFYSPLVRSMAKAEGVSLEELESVPGTGQGERVTKADLLRFLEAKRPQPTIEYPAERVEIMAMGVMRKAIAEHMVRSVHTSAHVTTVSEADVSRAVATREKLKDEFLKREGFALTYTPFFVSCAIRALKEYPIINSSLDGDNIIIKKFINVGIAVALEKGLIVPVVKGADEKSFFGLARAIHDLSERARHKKLHPDDVHGGTFTVTNPGMFGNLLGTPIINQPQVAILAIGAIKKRAVVIDDAIAIRSMSFLSLSYDHRVLDGALAGMFLQRIVQFLEEFDSGWVNL